MHAYWQTLKRYLKAARRDLQSLGLSLAIHAGVILIVMAWLYGGRSREFTPPPSPKVSVASRTLSNEQFNRNRQINNALLTPEQKQKRSQFLKELRTEQEKKEDKKTDEELEKKGQIVDLPRPLIDEKPKEEAQFLSEYNTRAEKETKSRHRNPDYEKAAHEVTLKGSSVDVQTLPGQAGKSQKAGQSSSAKAQQVAAAPQKKFKQSMKLALDPLLGRHLQLQESANAQQEAIPPTEENQETADDSSSSPKVATGEKGGAMAGHVGALNLNLPMAQLAKIAGTPPGDYLSEMIADGEGTFLNSRDFKYAAFWNRLKQSVGHHWRPAGELRRRDPTGNIYGIQDRLTIVTVVLNNKGELQSVQVLQSSGVDFLDKEAVIAFEKAQPFPNPPLKLANNGVIEFKFGFHVTSHLKSLWQ